MSILDVALFVRRLVEQPALTLALGGSMPTGYDDDRDPCDWPQGPATVSTTESDKTIPDVCALCDGKGYTIENVDHGAFSALRRVPCCVAKSTTGQAVPS